MELDSAQDSSGFALVGILASTMHSERDIKKSVVVDLWLQRLLDSVVGVRFNTQPRIYLVIDSEAANQSSDVEWPFL